MNRIARNLVALYSLLLFAAAGGLMALAWNDTHQFNITTQGFRIQTFLTGTTAERIILTIVLGAIIAFALVTLSYALWSRNAPERSADPLRAVDADGSDLELDPAAVEAYLRHDLESLPEVQEALPHVRSSHGTVETDLTVLVAAGADPAGTMRAVRETFSDALRNRLALAKVHSPRLRLLVADAAFTGLADPHNQTADTR